MNFPKPTVILMSSLIVSITMEQGLGLLPQLIHSRLPLSFDNDSMHSSLKDCDSGWGRRQFLWSCLSVLTIVPPLSIAFLPSFANAACLEGDPSPDCIGIYKERIDPDSVCIQSPQALDKCAPGLRYVKPPDYPKNYREARREMMALQKSSLTLEGSIMEGDLTGAGIILLRILPRVRASGEVAVESLLGNDVSDSGNGGGKDNGRLGRRKTASTQKRQKVDYVISGMRAESLQAELLNALGGCDVMIGQALRGDLGSITAAQIDIVSELRDINRFFGDLMKTLPDLP